MYTATRNLSGHFPNNALVRRDDTLKKNQKCHCVIDPCIVWNCFFRRGLWRPGSSKRELMNLILQSGKPSFDVPWTKAENSSSSTMAPKRSPWILWRYMTSATSLCPSVIKASKSCLCVAHCFMDFRICHLELLLLSPQPPQTQVLGLQMMMMAMIFPTHRIRLLHTPPMVR